MSTRTRAVRVAIVGGGCAATAAALELTRPEQAGRFEVTLYQVGWRLGGKGASGRGLAGRIEEHGLHVWMGWYENAFRLLRECYGELGRDWRTAFEPAPVVAIAEQAPSGDWQTWSRLFPPTPGQPGDPLDAATHWTVEHYLRRTASLLRVLLADLAPDASAAVSAAALARSPADILAAIASVARYGEVGALAGIVQAAALLEVVLGSLASYSDQLVLRLIDTMATRARAALATRLAADIELRRVWQIVDLALATIRGSLRFGLLTDPRGFDAVDDYDCREWLLLNGAAPDSVACGYMRALYDLGFGYEDGDPTRPRVSAGQALRGFMRAFFTYRGAFFWKMNGGMGDVVFAPIYEVLRRRGVRFAFFHKLTHVRLSPPASREVPRVVGLDFDLQARVRDGGGYRPLMDVQGLACWPAAPDYGQLEDGARYEREGWRFECHWDRRHVERVTLEVGRDFDAVVLGIGLGAIPHVGAELIDRDPRWRNQVTHVKTVATQAFQVWLAEDMPRLGWPGPPVTLAGFVEPFDTWADMGHLLARESWSRTPEALAYFCSVLPDLPGVDPADPCYPTRQREIVLQNAARFLGADVRHLWPRALSADGSFRWDLLVAPDGHAAAGVRGPARLATQHWTANVSPSDRYTLALPGTARHRLSPLELTADNLTVCGDWTDSGPNSGCVEAAVMSGRLAAHALSGVPALADIVGYDHP